MSNKVSQVPENQRVLEYFKQLREERTWHTELLVKTNASVSIGAAGALAVGALGANEMRGLGLDAPALVTTALACAIAGVAVFAAALVWHWQFRVRRARMCEKAIRALLRREGILDKTLIVECDGKDWRHTRSLFDPTPRFALFGWLMGIGLGAFGIGGIFFLLAVLFTRGSTQ